MIPAGQIFTHSSHLVQVVASIKWLSYIALYFGLKFDDKYSGKLRGYQRKEYFPDTRWNQLLQNQAMISVAAAVLSHTCMMSMAIPGLRVASIKGDPKPVQN